jgi:hypothetical protein
MLGSKIIIATPGAEAFRESRGSVERPERYFVGHDNSGHSYIVPWKAYKAWGDWVEFSSSNEETWTDAETDYAWNTPDYAERIDGGTLTFTDPRIE